MCGQYCLSRRRASVYVERVFRLHGFYSHAATSVTRDIYATPCAAVSLHFLVLRLDRSVSLVAAGDWLEIVLSSVVSPVRSSQGSHASWKVLDFFLQNSRTRKVLENHFGPGKSWKLKWKNILESHAFF